MHASTQVVAQVVQTRHCFVLQVEGNEVPSAFSKTIEKCLAVGAGAGEVETAVLEVLNGAGVIVNKSSCGN